MVYEGTADPGRKDGGARGEQEMVVALPAHWTLP